MKKLKNWDNHTWLSSKKYISQFNIFLNKKFKFKKKHLVLDIGCGRANIISELHKKYKFYFMPIGIDIIKNNNIKKNVIFKNINGIEFLKKTKKNYDLILLKQTIHFFNSKNINLLLNLSKKRLLPGGMLLIFTLKTKNNQIPCFKKMKNKLENSASASGDSETSVSPDASIGPLRLMLAAFASIVTYSTWLLLVGGARQCCAREAVDSAPG